MIGKNRPESMPVTGLSDVFQDQRAGGGTRISNHITERPGTASGAFLPLNGWRKHICACCQKSNICILIALMDERLVLGLEGHHRQGIPA